ncbi:sensor histidine kinase [Halobacillus mangrovi]|uniref:sensor histidine kinase n=1 Tax=Halobacillus mangrovi TaxID=402384 RepID=UPI0018DE4DDD|nr:HAMP domain-containing sensor histidine kinase [Halobacillus mangrovi]
MKHWSLRYLTTLLIGLVIIAVISIVWIRKTTIENRLDLSHLVAQEISDRIVNTNGRILAGPLFKDILEERSTLLNLAQPPTAVVLSEDGRVIANNQGPGFPSQPNEQLPSSIYKTRESTLTLEDGEKAYIISEPIKNNSETIGYVVLVQRESTLANINQEYRLLAVLLASLGLLGWLVIFYLTKHLSRPIKETVQAARQVSQGDYDIQMSHPPKEKELAELTETFTEMADRLKKLENMRTELLAGVTHDLKTPVTSISGLIQAVKDGIVEEEEAQEYLELSMKEIERLQAMIGDLLSFNTFVSGSLPISNRKQQLMPILKDLQKQWATTEKTPELQLKLPKTSEILVNLDDHRVKQILMNLLINAKHSMAFKEGIIQLIVSDPYNGYVDFKIKDQGSGIAEKDKDLIFERFYRGESKKLQVSGLGLGLPLSQMLAQALGGDLFLEETSSEGTTFTLKIPYEKA